jgi:hypothetical protein
MYIKPGCIVLVEPFVHLHKVENQPLEVVKHANLPCLEEVLLREVPYDIENMSKHLE